MKRPALAVVAFLCLDLVLSAQVANGVQGEQATQTQKAGLPLANTEVICMVQAGLDESTIVLAIEQKPTTAFDTSPDTLTELKKAGVSQAITSAMLRKVAPPSGKSRETSHDRKIAVSKQPTVQVGTFNVGKFPIGMAFDGTNIWVANGESNNVTKLRPSDGTVLGTFNVGTKPAFVALMEPTSG